MSKKRILPALVLAGLGLLGLHRIYAGRYVTGLLQLALFVPGAVMLWPDLIQMESMLTRMDSLQAVEQFQDWALHYQIHPLPWLLTLIPSVWVLIDCILLMTRRFRDGAGNKITSWI